MTVPFQNEPELNFADYAIQQKMKAAFLALDQNKGAKQPLLIDGKQQHTAEYIASTNPGKKEQVLGYAAVATIVDADAAMAAATNAFATYSLVPARERIAMAQNLVSILQKNRFEVNALIVEESGKNWVEADGEICETIDFINAYCLGMEELDQGISLLHAPDETTSAFYIPIGVGVIIPPWNFPLALMAGMVAGALITGNTVVVKPAGDTPLVAGRFIEMVIEAGFPSGTVNLITGAGSVVGNHLVLHQDTRFINFTGSKRVGLEINKLAAISSETGKWIKRIISEMGGKNAIIVDKSADVAKAAVAVAQSAFSFQGQKCSACSRALVHKEVYPAFIDAIVSYTKGLEMGLGRENVELGPVISKKAYDGIVSYIEIGRTEGVVVHGGSYDDAKGYYITPTIIKDILPSHRIAVEEIFGPVLAVLPVESFEQGLKIANDSEYGLTGSVFTTDEQQIQKAITSFMVGNLYINRKSTGAVVQQHPFGGYNMSGTAAKTGTKDYLYNFIQMKSVARKV